MKKLIAAGLAAAFVMGTPLAAFASWVHKDLKNGLSIKVNNTFKVTENTGKSATLEGTIYKKPAVVILDKDDSMDWSELTDKQIMKAMTEDNAMGFKAFKLVNEGKGAIGDMDGRYAAFDATVEGHPMHGYLSFAVAEGALYSVMMLYSVAGEKTEKVAEEIVNSADFTE